MKREIQTLIIRRYCASIDDFDLETTDQSTILIHISLERALAAITFKIKPETVFFLKKKLFMAAVNIVRS